MKSIITIAAAVCLWAGALTAQPKWLPVTKPGVHNLNAMYFVDSLRGWVGGDSGTIYRTTTGGESWTLQNFADSVYITDILMLDSDLGWATSIRPLVAPGGWTGSVLYSTTDGGVIWTGRSFEDTLLHTVLFHDDLKGWAGGENGILMRTTDGGQSWTAANVPPSLFGPLPVKKVRFFSPDTGFAVGGYPESAGVVRRTTDGGESWSITGFGDALNDVRRADESRIVCIGGGFDDGVGVATSTDGGGSWSFTYVGPFGVGTALAFRTPAESWGALGFTGTSMMSADSGSTWSETPNPGSAAMYAVQFLDDRHGFMAGDSGVVLKHNYPRSMPFTAGWNLISIPVDGPALPADSLFEGAVSPAYAYTPGGYVTADTLVPGIAYWLKHTGAPDEGVFGLPLESDTIQVAAGWNMVGTLSEPVSASSVSTVPGGILESPFYAYDNGYVAASVLLPGRGYWVKVNGAGSIVLVAD